MASNPPVEPTPAVTVAERPALPVGTTTRLDTTLRAARLARLFVWAVWGMMLLTALACIVRWGRNIPLAEDWTLVAPLTGHEQGVARWLWAQNNEHRLPLSKLLLLGLLKVTGGDFRVGMFANAAVLAAIAAAMIRTAARMRGGLQRWTDAFFPVLFLHIGNWENLVWGWQLQFTLSVALTCVLLLAVAGAPLLRPRWATAAAVAFVLLPLCGANGLIFTLAMAPWAAYVAFHRWRGSRATLHASSPTGERPSVAAVAPPAPEPVAGPRAGLLLGAAAALGLVLVGVYFIGYERPYWIPPNPGKLATLQTGAKFAAMAFGPAVSTRWNPAILGAALVLALVDAWRVRTEERERTLGLLCFAGGTAVLTLAMGYGRAAYVPEIGMPARYVLLAAPSLCAAYFIWALYGPRLLARSVEMGLCVIMIALLPANTRAGFTWRDWYVTGMRAVEQDIAAGVPRGELAHRHFKFLLHWNEELAGNAIGWLRDTGRGPFAAVRD
jgi:hypothetical protein